jgi:hypothetical protein
MPLRRYTISTHLPVLMIFGATFLMGHCHVRCLVHYPQHRTLPRPTETCLVAAFLRPFCKQRTQPPQLPLPTSVDRARHDARSYTRRVGVTTATNLYEMCCRDAGPGFCPIAVWRRTAQDRRSADRRPSDGKIKGARCAAVGRQKSIDRSDTPREVRKSATACGFVQPIEPAMIRAPRGRCRALRWGSYHSRCERRARDRASQRAHRPFF